MVLIETYHQKRLSFHILKVVQPSTALSSAHYWTEKNPMGYLVHAYLHRVEGDKDNAAYWYRLAGKAVCTARLDDEWEEIVEVLM